MKIKDCHPLLLGIALFVGGFATASLVMDVVSARGSIAPLAPPADPQLKKVWSIEKDIDYPDCAYPDPISGDILVSLLGSRPSSSSPIESPGNRNGKGRIARLSAAGRVLNTAWVKGLNAPKGMRIFQGTLWVADIDEIVGIDVATAEVTSRIKVPGAKALSGVAIGGDGTVYVSDTPANVIHTLRNGRLAILNLPKYKRSPGGVVMDGDALVVGEWGYPKDRLNGELFDIHPSTGSTSNIYPWPFAHIYGLEPDGKTGYLIGDWLSGEVLWHNGDRRGAPERIAQLQRGIAHFGFVADRSLLLVPNSLESSLTAYDVSGIVK